MSDGEYTHITFGGKKIKVNVENAEGVEGMLMYDGSGHFWFRIYDDDHNFEDFQIYHHDMKIKIMDSGASFYRTDGEKAYLDHSPAALGWKKKDDKED